LDTLEEHRQKGLKRKIDGKESKKAKKRRLEADQKKKEEHAAKHDEDGKTVFDFLNSMGKPKPARNSSKGKEVGEGSKPKGLNVQLVELQHQLADVKKEQRNLMKTWKICLNKDSLVAQECQRKLNELKRRAEKIHQEEKLINQKLANQKSEKELLKF